MREESNGSLSIGTLNMKRAHMRAGRLASTRGNYLTVRHKNTSHSTMADATIMVLCARSQHAEDLLSQRTISQIHITILPKSQWPDGSNPNTYTPHCNEKRLCTLRVTAWLKTAGFIHAFARDPHSYQSRHKAYVQSYQMSASNAQARRGLTESSVMTSWRNPVTPCKFHLDGRQ